MDERCVLEWGGRLDARQHFEAQRLRALLEGGNVGEYWIKFPLLRLGSLLQAILALFLIFWLLPNCRISAARVAAVAILVGLVLEGMKYVNLLIWPLLRAKLEREYGVFHNSVTILIWSFAAAMMILTAAQWAARAERQNDQGLEKDRAS